MRIKQRGQRYLGGFVWLWHCNVVSLVVLDIGLSVVGRIIPDCAEIAEEGISSG